VAEALPRLVPNSDSRLILLSRHAQVGKERTVISGGSPRGVPAIVAAELRFPAVLLYSTLLSDQDCAAGGDYCCSGDDSYIPISPKAPV